MSTLYTDEEIDQMTPLRVSFSYETTKEDIDILISTLKKIAAKHRLQNA